jgi:hypothetical protein
MFSPISKLPLRIYNVIGWRWDWNLKSFGNYKGAPPDNLEPVQNSAKALDSITSFLDEREIKKIDTRKEIAKLSSVPHDTI